MTVAVRRRLRRLGTVELLNVGLLGWLVFSFAPTAVNFAGFGLAALTLAEGGTYWLLKGGQLARARRRPRGMAAYRVLRVVNVAALAAGLALIGPAVVAAPGWSTWPGLAFWCLALIEHINYFQVQLMHDTSADLSRLRRTRRLRRSHLALDLRR